jgi:hypothetical protein
MLHASHPSSPSTSPTSTSHHSPGPTPVKASEDVTDAGPMVLGAVPLAAATATELNGTPVEIGTLELDEDATLGGTVVGALVGGTVVGALVGALVGGTVVVVLTGTDTCCPKKLIGTDAWSPASSPKTMAHCTAAACCAAVGGQG